LKQAPASVRCSFHWAATAPKPCQNALRLETPDPVLNRTFDFAKVRVAESIYATRGGLMLGPGGLSYYAAAWCNDNVEYAGPFFPFLGDTGGNHRRAHLHGRRNAPHARDRDRPPRKVNTPTSLAVNRCA